MDFLQKVTEKAKGLGGFAKEATRRSGDLLEVTRIKFDLAKLEKEMENNLAGLGALYFQKYKGATDVDEEIERLLQSTAKLEEDINTLENQIEKLQPKGVTCPDCNVDLPSGGKYCSFCGTKVVKEEQED